MWIEESWRSGGRRGIWVAIGAFVLLALAACNSNGPIERGGASAGADGAPSSQVPASPTSLSVARARQRATVAYVGMWREMAKAGEESDWRSPNLSTYATGDALSTISRGMYADHLNGFVYKGRPKNYPKVTSMDPLSDPNTVLISDCGDSTHWLKYRADNGKLADDEPGGRRSITAEVKRQSDGKWKVTRFAVEEIGSC